MSDAFDARAELEFSLKGARETLNDLQDLEEGLIDIGQAQDRAERRTKDLQKELTGLGKTFKETGAAARSAKKDLDPDSGASDEWKALSKAIREAESEYRELSKTAAAAGDMPVNLNGFMSKKGISAADLDAYRQGSNAGLLKDEAAEARKLEKERVASEKAAAAQIKRVNDVAAAQWIANEKRKEAEAKRASDAAARAWIAAEERITRGIDSGIAGASRGINTAGNFLNDRNNRSAGKIARQPAMDWDNAFNTAVADADKKVRSLHEAEMALAEQASPRLRYALYDVSTTARTTALSLTAAGAAVAVLAASQESAFTNVERTLDNVSSLGTSGVAGLRDELMGLTREIPMTFSQISEIATLGNQLGIAASEVAGFTETTARFSAVTGLTVEASATAFGSLRELLRNTDGTELRVDQFENLGSAIALVGRRSVATEAEIVSMSTRLAASATSAGFSAQEVIALSGAFASLRIAPERAQGVMEVYFSRLNSAISEGGPKLEAFAGIAGLATGEVEGLVRADPVKFFERLATGLGSMDSIARTGALEALGLSGIRAGEVFGRVSSNLGVFNKALQDSSQGWTESTELSNQFGLVLDDLSSKWQIFLNALAEAGGAIGTALAPNIIKALGYLTQMLTTLGEFAQTPFGETMFRLAGTAAMLITVLSGIAAVAAIWGGSLFAMRLAVLELGIVSATTSGGIGLFIARLLGLRTAGLKAATGVAATGKAAGGAAVGLRGMAGAALTARGALVALGRATIILGLVTAVADGLFQLADGANGAGAATDGLGKNMSSVGLRAAGASDSLDDIDWDAAAGGADDLGDSAGGAAEKIRTLADYASDLSGVMKRAFDIRFGGEQALDGITSGWIKIANAADQAREAAEEHQRALADMGADRSIKQYWLMVAENYGDELRAAKLRAELAELDADMADEKKDLVKAQESANKSLDGNSEAAISNRAEILGLVGNYQSYLQALAASGASQEELAAAAARLQGEFVQQATSLGYNRGEVEKYAASFGDMALIIGQMPSAVTIGFDGNPALTAMREFFAKAQAEAGAAGGSAGGGYGSGFNDSLFDALDTGLPPKRLGDAVKRAMPLSEASNYGDSVGGGLVDAFARRADANLSNVSLIDGYWVTREQERALLAGDGTGGKFAGGLMTKANTDLSNYRPMDGWAALQQGSAWNSGASVGGQVGGGIMAGIRQAVAGRQIGAVFQKGTGTIGFDGFSGGGYTGGTSAGEVRGAVHGKEFVFNADATRTIGVNNLAYMHNMAKQGKAIAPAGLGASNGGGTVDISAASARLIANLLAANLRVVLPGSQLAGSVGSHNVNSTSRGNA